MRFGAGHVGPVLAGAVLVAGTLTGCAGGGDARESAAASADAAGAVAERGGSVGAAGSACDLPVTFDIARDWKAEAVDLAAATGSAAADGGLADTVLRQGPVTLACEVDAKPAGNIGFLRVWTGEAKSADARSVLEAFLAAEGGVSGARYTPVTARGLAGVRAEYRAANEALGDTTTRHALAVTTPDGPVVLHLGGLDDEEHRQMLPAFELALRTVRPTG